MLVRDLDPAHDLEPLRACVVELQDHERTLDPRMPAGAAIVDEYVPQMLERCAEHDGRILVAEVDGAIAGYVSVWTKVRSEELEDGDLEYALVADLMVTARCRGRGVGRRLLEAARAHARESGAGWLRINVLAANRAARALYASAGFRDYLSSLEMRLDR